MNELVDDGLDRQAAVMVRSLSLSPSCSTARLMSFLSLYFLVVVAYFHYLPGICTTHTIGLITLLERRTWTLKNLFQVRKLCINHFMFVRSTARSPSLACRFLFPTSPNSSPMGMGLWLVATFRTPCSFFFSAS